MWTGESVAVHKQRFTEIQHYNAVFRYGANYKNNKLIIFYLMLLKNINLSIYNARVAISRVP